MSLLFFTGLALEAGERLHEVLEEKVPYDEIEIYRDITSLTNRFHRPRGYLNLMVLMAGTIDELVELISIKDLFYDVPIILILPDWSRETFSKGSKLYPRFYSEVDSDFSDVAMVMEKILKKISQAGDENMSYGQVNENSSISFVSDVGN